MAKSRSSSESHSKQIEELRKDFAALAAAIDPKDETKVWWNFLGFMKSTERVERSRAALRRKLPYSEDDISDLLSRTAYIQNGHGGLAKHDPTALLLKAAERVLGERRAEGKLRDALQRVLENLNAANPSVQRLRVHIYKLLG